jgi:hypothetical protein
MSYRRCTWAGPGAGRDRADTAEVMEPAVEPVAERLALEKPPLVGLAMGRGPGGKGPGGIRPGVMRMPMGGPPRPAMLANWARSVWSSAPCDVNFRRAICSWFSVLSKACCDSYSFRRSSSSSRCMLLSSVGVRGRTASNSSSRTLYKEASSSLGRGKNETQMRSKRKGGWERN